MKNHVRMAGARSVRRRCVGPQKAHTAPAPPPHLRTTVALTVNTDTSGVREEMGRVPKGTRERDRGEDGIKTRRQERNCVCVQEVSVFLHFTTLSTNYSG